MELAKRRNVRASDKPCHFCGTHLCVGKTPRVSSLITHFFADIFLLFPDIARPLIAQPMLIWMRKQMIGLQLLLRHGAIYVRRKGGQDYCQVVDNVWMSRSHIPGLLRVIENVK